MLVNGHVGFVELGHVNAEFFNNVRDEILDVRIEQAVAVDASDLGFGRLALVLLDRERSALEKRRSSRPIRDLKSKMDQSWTIRDRFGRTLSADR